MLITSLAWISNVCWLFNFFVTNTVLHPFTPTHPIGTNTTEPHPQTYLHQSQARLLQRPFDDSKIHHHVTPNPDQHSIIHLGVPKFPAWFSSMSREGPMLIEMTRLSTGTLSISISLQIKPHLPQRQRLVTYDSFAWAFDTRFLPMTPSTHWFYRRFSIASAAPLLMNILTMGSARRMAIVPRY